MTVLLTGATGFLGSRIYEELVLSHDVVTLSRQATGSQSILCDLAKTTPDLTGHCFDFVVHAAGKAHALPRHTREMAAYEMLNVSGTERLVAALERLPALPKSIIYISTVLVYGRSEGRSLDEQTPLGATDAYGRSKARAEAVVQQWAERVGVRSTILRLPLVVGDQPKGNLATMIDAIRRGYYVRIGDGLARRSMVRADDVAAVLERAASVGGTYNLTDGYHPTITELENTIAQAVGRRSIPTVPYYVARGAATLGDRINALIGRKVPLDSIALQKLTSSLTFSDDAARQALGWQPRPVLDCFR